MVYARSMLRGGLRVVGAVVLAQLIGFALPSTARAAGPSNAECLQCHDKQAHKIEVPGAGEKSRALLAIDRERYGAAVHRDMSCTACHTGATELPAAGAGHALKAGTTLKSAGCADCHEKLGATPKAAPAAGAAPSRLQLVLDNIAAYRQSFHARPSKADQAHPNATCDNCHDTHSFAVPPASQKAERAAWRLSSATSCASQCHSDELDEYSSSAHGKAVLEEHKSEAAVCSDCHTAHSIGNTSASPVKLAITAKCGSCHAENYASYKATYHGQISTLGFAHTAKCFDCHGSHGIVAVADPESKVHPNNRMETCQSCHNGKKGVGEATAGFATFQPHGNTSNFDRYPQMWIAYRMMVGLLVGTFAFFWLHTAMWFVREWKERGSGGHEPRVAADALPPELRDKHVQRFSWAWRVGHLLFAVSLMLLTLTGMPLFYPEAPWAAWLMNMLGGPHIAGLIHRSNAVVFAGVFFWHLVVIAVRIWRNRSTFRLFGPDSLVPNLQDLKDIVAMFRWFVGKGPRPVFDRWTYWEKFDYWAPFWGVTIIGVSGLVMWLPQLTASVLPGWVFNVAAIFHGEEAFLAVVFLFTVHFFNNHFRPEKFPIETVMFTGSMSLEAFKREHPLHFQRLRDSGELQRYLVDAPSPPMRLGSKVLGFTLIAVGLVLLFGVAVGFMTAA